MSNPQSKMQMNNPYAIQIPRTLTGKLELMPVIALDPVVFNSAITEKESHRLSENMTAAEVRHFLHQTLLDGLEEQGISNAEIIFPNRIRVTYLDDFFIWLMIQLRVINDIDASELFFNGEFHLVHESEDIFQSQCCCEWDDIENWQRAAQHRSINWEMVWIGHPHPYVRYFSGRLQFTDYSDEPTDKVLYDINPDALQAAVTQARLEIEDFRQRVKNVWAEVYPTQS